MLLLVKEFELVKAQLFQMLCDSRDRPTSEERPILCNNGKEMEGKNIYRKCRIGP